MTGGFWKTIGFFPPFTTGRCPPCSLKFVDLGPVWVSWTVMGGFSSVSSGSSRRLQRLLAVRSMDLSFDIGVLRVTQVTWKWRGWLMKFIA